MNSVEGEITGIKYYFQEFEIHHFIRFYEICLQKLIQIVSIICHFLVKKNKLTVLTVSENQFRKLKLPYRIPYDYNTASLF